MTLLIDTHAHLYARQFESDREAMIARARTEISHIILPNIDAESIPSMLDLAQAHPDFCFPLMGLHPCSVSDQFENELKPIREALFSGENKYWGIGETGLDYYWDKTFIARQKTCLREQITWAKELNLPLILHCRESMDDVIELVQEGQDGRLRGIFHCFNGTVEQAQKIIDANFLLGIGGVVTYKNSGVAEVIAQLPMQKLVLETDAPYLAPVPWRGKRNESAYVRLVAQKVAETFGCDTQEVARVTSQAAIEMFNLPVKSLS